MDICIKCYYLLAQKKYPVSRVITEQVWQYLLSDSAFLDFFKNTTDSIEKTMKISGQRLQELRVSIFTNTQGFSVNLVYYSKERCTTEPYIFYMPLNSITQSADIISKGFDVKKTIDKERNKVHSRTMFFFCMILLALAIPTVAFGIYVLNTLDISLMIPAALLLCLLDLIYSRFSESIWNCVVMISLPNETEIKLVF